MKKLLFFISIFFTFLVTSISPTLAQEKELLIVPEKQTIEQDYFGFAQRVEINGTVNGDAYIAGGVIILNGTINGDVLAAGGNVTISGLVTGDIRAAGGNITLTDATVNGNVTLGGGNVNIDKSSSIEGSIVIGSGNLQVFAPIGKSATLGGGSILLANSIGSDVKAATEDFSLTKDAKINGNLTYWAENEANISDGASISGVIKKEIPKDRQVNKSEVEVAGEVAKAIGGIFIAIKIIDLFWLAIFGLVLVIFLPNFSARTSDYTRKKFGWSLLFGFVALITLPIISIILMVSLIGIPVAFILFIFFMFLFWIARVFAILTIGRLILEKTSKNKSMPVAYLIGLLIYLILSIIPVIGFLTSVAVTLSGVGALLATKKEAYQKLRSKNDI